MYSERGIPRFVVIIIIPRGNVENLAKWFQAYLLIVWKEVFAKGIARPVIWLGD